MTVITYVFAYVESMSILIRNEIHSALARPPNGLSAFPFGGSYQFDAHLLSRGFGLRRFAHALDNSLARRGIYMNINCHDHGHTQQLSDPNGFVPTPEKRTLLIRNGNKAFCPH